MITVLKGDVTSAVADVLVNPVNCVGVMGAGCALTFKRKFPAMYQDYRRACLSGKVYIKVVGSKVKYRPHVWVHPSGRLLILNLPTKIHWKQPSRYEYVAAGLLWIRANFPKLSALLGRPIKAIAMPPLGCGLGGSSFREYFPPHRKPRRVTFHGCGRVFRIPTRLSAIRHFSHLL